MLFLTLLLAFVAAVQSKVTVLSDDTLDCKTFDPKRIKLVTFDVFAALMDLETSLTKSVATILPTLSSKDVTSFVQQWEGAYSDQAGNSFDQAVTGPSPFQFVLRGSLDDILSTMSLTVTSEQYDALIYAWGELIPWENTAKVLQQVYAANYTLGTLSNGDKETLARAMQVFAPNVQFTYFFSSDFPVGAFKPDPAMYRQLPATSALSVQEILHVAGANIDGWGARDAGLFSALVYSKPYPKKPLPCFLLDDITDLLPVLGL